MSEYTPPNGLQVNLDFKDEFKSIDGLNLTLNFGSDSVINLAQIKIKTQLKFRAVGGNELPIDNHGNANIKVRASFKTRAIGSLDFDHLVGVSKGLPVAFRKTISICAKNTIPWSQPILMTKSGAIYTENGLFVASKLDIYFDNALTLSELSQIRFERGLGFTNGAGFIWQEAKKRLKNKSFIFENGEVIAVKRAFQYQETLKRRKTVRMSHDVAEQFTKTFVYKWDKGLEIVTQNEIRWEDADQIHYRKHLITPWPSQQLPKYIGSTNLELNCLCHEVDAHNVVLNFGVDDCLPQKPEKNWWYILNNISVTRLDNNEPIDVIDGSYETGRERNFWTYTLTLAPDQLNKLQPDGENPVILKIMINGFEHQMLVEGEPKETRRFAQTLFELNGRSQTALDSETYSAKRSFLQENERRAAELCQLELDRVFSNTLLDWQLLEENGWIIPTQSLTYTNLAPINAIKLIIEAGGGFIYSHKASKTLSILPKYKKGYWDPMQIEDYDLILDEDMMLQHEIKRFDTQFDYNSILMFNTLTGNDARVSIADTAKNVPLPTESSPLFTTVSMSGYAKTALCKANVKERHTFSQMPVSQDIGEMLPGKTLAFGGVWWGVVDTVKGTFNQREVWETVEVERISRE